MNVYKKTERHPLKWIVALIIFMLAMGFTTNDVYGVNIPPGGSSSDGYEQPVSPADQSTDGFSDPSPTCPPPEIPEPMTLILVAAGLGALHLARRKRKA